jgi:hypothetical protein
MLMSVHIAEVGVRKAAATLRKTPRPETVQGLRYAGSWLTFPLRTGMKLELVPTGVLMLAAWDDDESLDKFLHHPAAKPYRGGWQTRMTPARSIGTLPGLPDLPRQEQPAGDQPVAAFTLGRLRPGKLLPFLATTAAAEREAQGHPGFIEGVGIFRPPLGAGTFSLWRNVRTMRDYALGSYPGGHKKAIEVDQERRFWHEMLFSRYLPYMAEGQWKGSNPLAELEPGRQGLINYQRAVHGAADALPDQLTEGLGG